MSDIIIKIRDRFFVWSTIADAPISNGLSEPQLRRFLPERHGEAGIADLPERLARVAATGTSCRVARSLEDFVAFNRAGPDETCLSAEEIYRQYATDAGPPPVYRCAACGHLNHWGIRASRPDPTCGKCDTTHSCREEEQT